MINILMGMSASGKDTILRELVKWGINPIISYTTRPIRDGEIHGKDYIFTTKEKFIELMKENDLIEFRSYPAIENGETNTWYYGLRKQHFDNKKSYVVILDVQGTKEFIDYVGLENCNIFCVFAPEELREHRARLRGGFDIDEWERRADDDYEKFSESYIEQTIGVQTAKKIKVINNYKPRTIEKFEYEEVEIGLGEPNLNDLIEDIMKEINKTERSLNL